MKKIALLFIACGMFAADWKPLFNGKNLDGWESIGDGQWTVIEGGVLVGQRTQDLKKLLAPGSGMTLAQYKEFIDRQAWLYTVRNDFDKFDLHLEYWTRTSGNSGVSIRDTTRAQYAVAEHPDFKKTPSKVAYEIQINNRYPDPHPSGSIYGFMDAAKTWHHDDDWNVMEISARPDKITVSLNGHVVAEHPGDPARPKVGPIGLQLHDQLSVIHFRNIKIREVK